jgi:hypothetical protein
MANKALGIYTRLRQRGMTPEQLSAYLRSFDMANPHIGQRTKLRKRKVPIDDPDRLARFMRRSEAQKRRPWHIETVAKSKALADRVRELRLAGMTFIEAGAELGMSKNVAIGLIQRYHPEMMVAKSEPPRPRLPHAYDTLPPGGCQWPHGDPGAPDFRFCRERRKEGRPYCAEHAARAYIRRSAAKAEREAIATRWSGL